MWERIWCASLAALDQHGQLDWRMAFLSGSFALAQKGGDKVGLTKKGKGTKWVLAVEGNGLPLGFHLASANAAKATLAEQTLDIIRACRSGGCGRPKQRPTTLVADRGYDSGAFRRSLWRRGIQVCNPPKRRPATWRLKRGRPVVVRQAEHRRRFTAERRFAWLGNIRRLLARWEHHCDVCASFFTVALMVVCLRL